MRKEALTVDAVQAEASRPGSDQNSPWRLMSELAELALPPRGTDVGTSQRARLRGIGMATVSSLLIVLIAAGLFLLGMVPADSFFTFGLMTAIWNIAFGSLRRNLSESHRGLSMAYDTIKHMATHDELTGVLNRRHLVEVLSAEKARAERYGGLWSVCMIDLDNFKRVNDKLGHSSGDLVLREFARAAQRIKRPTDAFGRYGGEEFMLILVQTGADAAVLAAERLRTLAEILRFNGLDPNFRMTISIGVAEARSDESWQATLDRADQALYRAKQGGRNRLALAV